MREEVSIHLCWTLVFWWSGKYLDLLTPNINPTLINVKLFVKVQEKEMDITGRSSSTRYIACGTRGDLVIQSIINDGELTQVWPLLGPINPIDPKISSSK